MAHLESIKSWIGTNLPKYEVPPSRFEVLATSDFINEGLKPNNRLVTIASAIPAIAASTIMIFVHPTNGLLKGAINLIQFKASDGTYEVTLGLFNATRSIYNIILIFGTAVLGLALPSQMYSAMESVLKEAENSEGKNGRGMPNPTESTTELLRLRTQLATITAELEITKSAAKTNESEAKEQLGQLQSTKDHLEAELEKAKSAARVSEDTNDMLSLDLLKMKGQLATVTAELESATSAAKINESKVNEQLGQLQYTKDHFEAELEAAKAAAKATAIETNAKLEVLQNTKSQVEEKLSALTAQLADAAAELEAAKTNENKTNEDLEELKTAVDRIEAAVSTLTPQLEDAAAELEAAKAAAGAAEIETNKKLEALQNTKDQLEVALEVTTTRIHILEASEQNLKEKITSLQNTIDMRIQMTRRLLTNLENERITKTGSEKRIAELEAFGQLSSSTADQLKRKNEALEKLIEEKKSDKEQLEKVQESEHTLTEEARLEDEIKTANATIAELRELAENAKERLKSAQVKFISISKLGIANKTANSKHEEALESLRKHIEILTEQKTTHEERIAQFEADGNANGTVREELEGVNEALRKARTELDNAMKSHAKETEVLDARFELTIEDFSKEEFIPLQVEHEQLIQKLATMRVEMTALQEAVKTAQQNNVSVEPAIKALGEVKRILTTNSVALQKLNSKAFSSQEAIELLEALKTTHGEKERLEVQNKALQGQVEVLLKQKQALKIKKGMTADKGSTPEVKRGPETLAIDK